MQAIKGDVHSTFIKCKANTIIILTFFRSVDLIDTGTKLLSVSCIEETSSC